MNVCPQCNRPTPDEGACPVCGAALISEEQQRDAAGEQPAALKAERLDDQTHPAAQQQQQPLPYAYRPPYPQAQYAPAPAPRPVRPDIPRPPHYALKLLFGALLSVCLFAGALLLANYLY